jgi:hypothetical protein
VNESGYCEDGCSVTLYGDSLLRCRVELQFVGASSCYGDRAVCCCACAVFVFVTEHGVWRYKR